MDGQEMSILETFRRCELFLGLDDSQLIKIADLPSCQVKETADQEIIFKGGEQAADLYVVAEGMINLVLKLPASSSHPEEQSLWGTITKGGVFGWGAVVPPSIRIGSAISKGSSTLVSIGGDELRALFDADTRLGYEVMKGLVRIVSSRVWSIEKLLASGKRSPFI
jgi:CRP-like cAMP-binding protein